MRFINFSNFFLVSAAMVAFGEYQEPAKTLQIHLAYGGTAKTPGMIVTWQLGHMAGTELKENQTPRVWYSKSAASLDKYVDVKEEDSCTYFMSGQHVSAEITGLEHHTEYFYQVGVVDSKTGEEVMDRSEVKSFRSARSHEQDSGFAISVFGDLGYGGKNDEGHADTTKHRLDEIREDIDFYIHAGDIGYADNSFLPPSSSKTELTYEKRYNDFMDELTTITETKPYMPCVGNHEIENHSRLCLSNEACKFGLGNFTAYNCRWKTPAKQSDGALAMWYSFDYGSIHFVVTNTETDHPNAAEEHKGALGNIPAGHFGQDGEYLKWLESDLAKADKNREERPWIVTIGHRPLYVLDGKKSYCAGGNGETTPQGNCAAHEGLINKYSDLHIAGHIHYSSRLLPANPFGAFRTALVVPGGAGNDESPSREYKEDNIGSSENFDYYNYGTGYSTGIIRAVDRYHLSYDLIDSQTGKSVDHFEIAKNHCNPSGANSFRDIRTSLDKVEAF